MAWLLGGQGWSHDRDCTKSSKGDLFHLPALTEPLDEAPSIDSDRPLPTIKLSALLRTLGTQGASSEPPFASVRPP